MDYVKILSGQTLNFKPQVNIYTFPFFIDSFISSFISYVFLGA